MSAATDGSALGNPGPGGWAWITEDGRYGAAGARHTTNNRMELRALIELLLATDPAEELLVHVDSQYVVNIFTKWLVTWRARGMRRAGNKPIVNLDLIERAGALLEDRSVTFAWVRGHSGHRLNEKADRLANEAAHRAARRLRRQTQ
jgi:ribonuclease HI